jgi:transposase-like protein
MAMVDVKCRYCNQTEDVKKYGKSHRGHQKYRCFACQKVFQLEYTNRACQPGMKEQIIELAMNNAGIRDSSRSLGVAVTTILRVLKNSAPDASQPLRKIDSR